MNELALRYPPNTVVVPRRGDEDQTQGRIDKTEPDGPILRTNPRAIAIHAFNRLKSVCGVLRGLLQKVWVVQIVFARDEFTTAFVKFTFRIRSMQTAQDYNPGLASSYGLRAL